MDTCTCHLCGEAMEPDVVMELGDTCEACWLASITPEMAAAAMEKAAGRADEQG